MTNTIRSTVGQELKDPLQVMEADPFGWWAIHTTMIAAAHRIGRGEADLLTVAMRSLKHVGSTSFGLGQQEESRTRFTAKSIMAWQDALFVVNELPEWRFPDEVLLVAWLIECGGPEMKRGPARASFQNNTPAHYIDGTRALYNRGAHGNGPGWPTSHSWSAGDCRYMARVTR